MRKTLRSFWGLVVAGILSTIVAASFIQQCPLSPIPHVLSGESIYRQAAKQTVLVETDGGYGTGFVVLRDNISGHRVFVWTAAHVVDNVDVAKVHVFSRTGGSKAGDHVYDAKVVYRPAGVDATLLLVNAPAELFEGAKFDFAPPKVGCPTYHVGNLYGPRFDGSLTSGVISQLGVNPGIPGWPWPLLDQTSALAVPGSSGGPVYNARNGKVLGILVSGPGVAGISCYVPVRLLATAVDNLSWTMLGSRCPSDVLLDQLVCKAKLPPKPVVFILPLLPAAPDAKAPVKPVKPSRK